MRPVIYFFLAALIFTAAACQQQGFTPKPRGFFRVDFPKKEYRLFDEPGYPYSFEYPVYANIVKDTLFFDAKAENPWWINVDFPQFNSKVYMSYKTVGAQNSLDKLINDAFKLTYKHTLKAESINEEEISTPNNVHGLFYEVGGNAASAKQFYVTDSFHHYLRGALYFYAPPNADSLAPMHKFLQEDMWHLVETLKWKANK
ncbi:gliding motility lipoprotein GldD [Chitinophaga niabensis]|uniref:Gliding motility-associated lipoprotein GldD n=1 Tax=Chitinophaga niabensis TaxID=536979 RepID=A0A1N6JIC0_9BACT|nr:gliding motility lipoprotein GldD [Chitinophaga niabensis]SIO43973.1 gliding motility-associated lipoprotein GldD [Chitinophaga niabensis]